MSNSHSPKALQGVISRVSVFTAGDSSVGIARESATITANGDFLLNLDVIDACDRVDSVEQFRAKIADAFRLIWDEPATVMFDFETEEAD